MFCPLQYIRVMQVNAQCTEVGPFFPQTPRYAIQNGMGVEQDILKSPDWVVICAMLASVFFVMILLIVGLVRKKCSAVVQVLGNVTCRTHDPTFFF